MGSGGFGQVVAAKCRDKRSELYGAKVALKFQGNCSAKEGRFNLDEVSLLKFCEHPNIVRIHQALDVGLEVFYLFLFIYLFIYFYFLLLSLFSFFSFLFFSFYSFPSHSFSPLFLPPFLIF